MDIYIQKNGAFSVVIPKGKPVTEFGFNAGNLEKSTGQHLKPSGLPIDIPSLFINENEKQRFFRLISISGHGSYPGFPEALNPEQPGVIAGIPTNEFQKTLKDLKEKNTAFLLLFSCYSAGTNVANIHLPEETLPYPIYVNSSFDLPTKEITRSVGIDMPSSGGYDRTKVLVEVQKLIFPTDPLHALLRTVPRQLTQRDRESLSRIMDYPFLVSKFTNLGTLFLPSNKSDIPKVAYTLANPKDILDVTRAYQKEIAFLNKDAKEKTLRDTQMGSKATYSQIPLRLVAGYNS